MSGEQLLNNTSTAELTALCVTVAAMGEWFTKMGWGMSLQCVFECREVGPLHAVKGFNLII